LLRQAGLELMNLVMDEEVKSLVNPPLYPGRYLFHPRSSKICNDDDYARITKLGLKCWTQPEP
jgi:hypothetical protein